jgi:putative PIN family toxin of toxin-antitoxin system
MKADIRAVIDTNVLVSAALLSASLPRRLVDWLLSEGSLLQSEDSLAEVEQVLRRPKFDKYLDEADRLAFSHLLKRAAERVDITVQIRECRDPKDDKFLELAVSGNATHLVTGDMDLLVLHPFRGIAIINPSQFLQEMTAK